MIRHDNGATFILVWCASCEDWAHPAMSKMHAHLIGARHEKSVHPERDTALDSAYSYARGHAEELAAFRRISEFATMIESWEFGQDSRRSSPPM